MAAMAELDSFIGKYKQLWKKGCDVTLTLKSVAGKATISLDLSLDDMPSAGLIQQTEAPFTVLNSSNSRERRRKRREAHIHENVAVNNAGNDNVLCENGVVAHDLKSESNSEIKVECKEDTVKEDIMVKSISQDYTTTHMIDLVKGIEDGNAQNCKVEQCFIEEDSLTSDIKEDDIRHSDVIHGTGADNKKAVTNDMKTTDNDANAEDVLRGPIYESVYATAEIKCCKTSVTDVEINALNCILKSRDHLVRNIRGVESGACQSVRDKDNGYRHLLPLVFTVDTTHLWENSRSYVYHHLGRDTWTKDGTEIRLIRIHRK